MKTAKTKKTITHSVLTLGNFDGTHLGHQKILKNIIERAEALGCASVVYTFDPHPVKVVAPHKDLPLITTFQEKAGLFADFNIDYLVCARFTKEFASQHPDKFVKDELVDRLKVREIWVGHDYAFGKGRQGTAEYLKQLGKRFGFDVYVVPVYRKCGMVVSSSNIRKLVLSGDVKKASSLLGRFYSISGKVVKGKNRGKQIGFPTANIETQNELIPKKGVYAVICEIFPFREKDSKKTIQKQAAVNIGSNPTFEKGDELNIEAHVIDFSGNLYNKNMRLYFIQRIRDEVKFKNPLELTHQIEKDVRCAERLLRRKHL
ncbi:MAG: bifunctional riboflavin kinase/FAD synthetase [Deltaproteobacteria bacterium]|nr:bifunctional riboflavin kinase/FAD synthetase [Deltaproteobacteria bacterium]